MTKLGEIIRETRHENTGRAIERIEAYDCLRDAFKQCVESRDAEVDSESFTPDLENEASKTNGEIKVRVVGKPGTRLNLKELEALNFQLKSPSGQSSLVEYSLLQSGLVLKRTLPAQGLEVQEAEGMPWRIVEPAEASHLAVFLINPSDETPLTNTWLNPNS